MIMAMVAAYLVLLHLLFNVFKVVKASNRNKIIVTIAGCLGIFAFWYVVTYNQPQSNQLLVYRTTVQMVPRVSGRVIEVDVERNKPVSKGDVLFRLDPRAYQYKLNRLNAELELAKIRFNQATILAERNAGPLVDVQRREAEVNSLEAQVDNAELDLAETVVYAPSNGYVTAMLLQPGFVATQFRPALTFIDTDSVFVGAAFKQQSLELAQIGDPAEIALDRYPGRIFIGTVSRITEASGAGILAANSPVPTFTGEDTPHARFFVQFELDDKKLAQSLPPGASGAAAIYSTKSIQQTAMIRRVAIRFYTFFNYVLPDG